MGTNSRKPDPFACGHCGAVDHRVADEILSLRNEAQRVADMRAWARNRIEACRKVEAKLGASPAAVDAAIERRTLQNVLDMIGGAI